MTIWPFVFISLVVGWVPAMPWPSAPSLSSLVGLLSLFSTLSKAHLGYLQWARAIPRCSISFWNSSNLLHTVFPLWVRVFITLYLGERWWRLTHCKYWSVWVGFLYTVIDNLPSASGLTVVSKKGMAPSSLLFSTVNLMAQSTLFMCWRKLCLFSSLWTTKVSSTYLSHILGWVGSSS